MLRYVFPLLLTMLLLQETAAAQEGIDQPYLPPPSPVLLDPNTPSFAPFDIEVDAFVRIPAARSEFNVDGRGLAVAVIDTGVNSQHVSFHGRVIPGKNFSTVGGPNDTTDTDGHGSNVGGIILGAQLPPDVGVPTGIAPAAHIIPLKVFPGGQFDKISEALQWVLDQRDRIMQEHNALISVVNMSLGNSTNNQSLSGQLPAALQRQRDLIKELRDAGIVVTVAAGNHYKGFAPQQGMGFPAICPETTSVGAVFDVDIARPNGGFPLITYADGGQVFSAHPGRLTVFSQRLGAAAGGSFRTDVFAPGFIVTSAGPVPPANSNQDPTRTRTTQDGTSQATPVTSGVVLLLQQHYRNLMQQIGSDPTKLPPVDLIEECLRDGGVRVADPEDATAMQMDNVQSCGADDLYRVDAVSALTYMTSRLQSDLRSLQFELLRTPKTADQDAVLEKASILGREAKKLDARQ